MTEDNPQKRSIEDLSFGSLNLIDFIVLAYDDSASVSIDFYENKSILRQIKNSFRR